MKRCSYEIDTSAPECKRLENFVVGLARHRGETKRARLELAFLVGTEASEFGLFELWQNRER
jgi:hypothetical protein